MSEEGGLNELTDGDGWLEFVVEEVGEPNGL